MWKGSMTVTVSGIASTAAALKPVKPYMASTRPVAPSLWQGREPGGEDRVGTAHDHIEQPGRGRSSPGGDR